MHQLAGTMRAWLASGRRFAVATTVRTQGSSPQSAGACMVVAEDGEMAGSVSGGCIEGVVVQAAIDCIRRGEPEFLNFHAVGEDAGEVGIPCGGEAGVFVAPFDDEVHAAMLGLVEQDASFFYVAVIDEKNPLFGAHAVVRPRGDNGVSGKDSCVASWMDDLLLSEALAAFETHRESRFKREGRLCESAVLSVMGSEVFVRFFEPRPTLVCVGAVHIAEALVEMARLLRFRTIVVDPRSAFLAGERFARADRILRAWPQEAFAQLDVSRNTAVCALTHDEKIDVPALAESLNTDAFYIGCLGSPETLLDRRRKLEEMGFGVVDFRRIYGPIGLYIGGGRRPEAIALSVMSQIVAVMTGRISFAADMPGHTLDSFTQEKVARIAADRERSKSGVPAGLGDMSL